jgi:hypothetical protein
MGFDEMTALLAPHSATLFLSGDSDAIIDKDENGALLVRHTKDGVESARKILRRAGMDGTVECRFIPGADHRPLFLTHDGVAWMQDHLMQPAERPLVPQGTVKFGDWADTQGEPIEKLYNTEARERGNLVVDVGAAHLDPHDLACFPDQENPFPEYTFQGWIDSVLASNTPSSAR